MPRPFSFKLEKVLDYRGQLEEQAKAALAKAQTDHDTQKEKVENLTQSMATHLAKEHESQKTANDMWLWRQYKDALEQDLSRERLMLSKLELNLHQRRKEAVDKSKDRKLLEKLKETQAKKYHDEERAREEKENDEMATIRYKSQDF
ncbi:flagellar export protein FliJ [Pseudodesulfovibrio piezophilus]|uniref:Flagellar FliJ protein n=1 Tax=Pseudodesulfovibrio piezophilus (strain DSM 21447 / JCM 15486 / C1TLV30) TaxID=1322246 RepID=M1WWK7_PSEP2|nr:flagellar export protein FliJ [Pseudodesulfovibrio piezophilus]CCH49188.1 Flagellar export protein FliJ [Pseudodesulfovibrio piezophilus C1TLV30]